MRWTRQYRTLQARSSIDPLIPNQAAMTPTSKMDQSLEEMPHRRSLRRQILSKEEGEVCSALIITRSRAFSAIGFVPEACPQSRGLDTEKSSKRSGLNA
jgi:hypothetical protein